MKVLYDEGVASHVGLESCVGVREGAGEALTEGGAGHPFRVLFDMQLLLR